MWSIGNLSSDARQPEVSLFLFNMPWQNQICIPTCFLLLKRRFAPKFVQNHRLKCAKSPLPVDVRSSLKTSLFKVLLKIMTDKGNLFTSHEGNFQHHFVCLFFARPPHQNCARVSHAMVQLFQWNHSITGKG